MNQQFYVLSDEGIKVLANQISEQIKSNFNAKSSTNEDEFLSIQETAKLINLSKATVYGLVHQKNIPFHKKGKRLYFLKSDILDWIKSGKCKTKLDIQKQAGEYLANNNLF